MNSIDIDEATNIDVARLHRFKLMTPVERRAQVLYDTGRYKTKEEAEDIAYSTMEKEPCERP